MLKVSNLSFSFDDKEKLLSEFSLTAQNGERICVMGASGEGKTTLLKLIAGLLSPKSGKIEAEGKIGMVFQSDVLFPWQTALENVKSVCDEETAKRWLCAFGLEEALDKKPAQLSGGMCRRVAIARAVAFEPDILLLDEPFKGLDEERKESIMTLIKEHFSDRLVIFTTHDSREEEFFATRTVMITDSIPQAGDP